MLEEDNFLLSDSQRHGWIPLQRRLSTILFETCLGLEDSKRQMRPQHFRLQTVKFALSHVYIALCLLSFLNVTQNTHTQTYFWGFLLWLRLDYLCFRLSPSCVYATWAIILFHLAVLLYVSWRSMRKDTESVSGFLKSLPLLNSQLLSGFDVSLASMLLALGLKSLKNTDATTLYPIVEETFWKSAVSLGVFALFFLFQCFREFKNSYFEHSQATVEITSRSTSYTEFFRLFLTHAISISYFTISLSNSTLHLLLTLFCCGVTIAVYYRRVPYYNSVANAVIAGCFSYVGTSAIVVILADFVDSPLFSALGTLLWAPTIGGLVVYHYNFHYYPLVLRYYEERLHKAGIRTFQVELGMRTELKHAKADERAVEIIRKVLLQHRRMETARPKSLLLWVVDFSVAVLRDEALARLKLAQAAFSTSDFESNYQFLRFSRLFAAQKSTEAVEYLKYFQRMRVIRRTDLRLCHFLADFYSQLASKSPDRGKICACTRRIDTSIRFLKGEYKAIIKDFPRTKEAAHLFASFLEDVLRIYDKAQTVRIKANVFSTSERKVEYADYDSKVSFFQKDCGVLFVSAAPRDLGVIVYANDLAHMALGYSLGTLPGTPLCNLIPQPFRARHCARLREFLSSSVSLDLRHPSILYITGAAGFLIECITNLTVTAVEGPPVMLLAMKPTETFKEVAIIGEGGEIAACSKEFSARIGFHGGSAIGMKLEHVNASIHRFSLSAPFTARHFTGGNESYCVFSGTTIGNFPIRLLYIIDTEEEASYWAAYSREFATGNMSSSMFRTGGILHSPSGEASLLDGSLSIHPQISRADTRRTSVMAILEPSKRQRKLVQFSPPNSDLCAPSRVNKKEFTISLVSASGFTGSVSFSNSSINISSDAGAKLLADMNLSFRLLKYVTIATVFLTQMLVLVVGNVIIGNFLNEAVTTVINNDLTHDYALRVLYIMRIAQNARYIDLGNRGVLQQGKIPLFRDIIQSSASDCETIQQRLLDRVHSSELQDTVYVWELMDGDVVSKRVNLITAVRNIIDRALSLMPTNTSQWLLSNPNMFYLFRNGLGETLTAARNSLGRYVEQSKHEASSKAAETILYFLPFVGLLLVTSLFSLHQLYRVQKKVTVVSDALLSFPIPLYAEMRKLVYERLSTVHGEEILAHDFSLRDRTKPILLFNASARGAVIILIFFGVSLLWYALEYFWIIDSISNDMTLWPKIIEMSLGRITDTVEMWTWMFEAYLYANSEVSFQFLPGLSYCPHPAIEFLHSYSQSRVLSLATFQQELDGTFRLSASDQRTMYSSTSFSSPYLTKGLYLGLNLFREDAMTVALSQDVTGIDAYAILRLYYCEETVVSVVPLVHELYDREMMSRMQKQLSLLTVFVAVHTVVVLFGLSLGIFWTVTRTNTQVRAMWRALHLFPGDAQNSSLMPTRTNVRTRTVFH